ncbi:hypothetical protein [Kineosporia mesophila]|uniref:hypothetical protein n=1 Tax=Kineosporia mesophila TaxID=566012 RepID=UPI001E49BE67|nr:hypothetical protein [Kineosporia mesophila]MCD5353742.1 hypothetical protein [Kineosporia mesophila]
MSNWKYFIQSWDAMSIELGRLLICASRAEAESVSLIGQVCIVCLPVSEEIPAVSSSFKSSFVSDLLGKDIFSHLGKLQFDNSSQRLDCIQKILPLAPSEAISEERKSEIVDLYTKFLNLQGERNRLIHDPWEDIETVHRRGGEFKQLRDWNLEVNVTPDFVHDLALSYYTATLPIFPILNDLMIRSVRRTIKQN